LSAEDTALEATLAPLLGDNSPRRARVWEFLAELLSAAGRDAEATHWRERATAVLMVKAL
jgi:hypothetical protein